MHYALCSLHPAPCTMYYALCIKHLAPCALRLAPCAMHFARCTLNLASWTLHLDTAHGTHPAVCTCHVGGSCFLCSNSIVLHIFPLIVPRRHCSQCSFFCYRSSRHWCSAHSITAIVRIDTVQCDTINLQSQLCQFKVKCIFDDVTENYNAHSLIITNITCSTNAIKRPH